MEICNHWMKMFKHPPYENKHFPTEECRGCAHLCEHSSTFPPLYKAYRHIENPPGNNRQGAAEGCTRNLQNNKPTRRQDKINATKAKSPQGEKKKKTNHKTRTHQKQQTKTEGGDPLQAKPTRRKTKTINHPMTDQNKPTRREDENSQRKQRPMDLF